MLRSHAIAATAAPVLASTGVATLSGAGIMSNLAVAGSMIGGGAVAGVGILAAAPAAAAVAIANNTLLKPRDGDDDAERLAKSAGRMGNVAGAAAGLGGSIAAISSAGTVGGLSATGITSGLAAIGSIVGGGMAAGTVIAIAAPTAVAVGIAFGSYHATRALRRRRRRPTTTVD